MFGEECVVRAGTKPACLCREGGSEGGLLPLWPVGFSTGQVEMPTLQCERG